MIRHMMKDMPVFADEDQTVRIWDGFPHEGCYLRYSERESPDYFSGVGPFVLLSDYQALHDKVYGKTKPEVCDGDED